MKASAVFSLSKSLAVCLFFLAASSISLRAEVHVMTLDQALTTALEQNPDVMLARLDQRRAAAQVDIARDPFTLKLGAGSGLAATWGFPSSIDGSSPSILQARGNMAIFDRAQRYRVDQAREAERGSALDVDMRQTDVAYQVYSAFLDAEQAGRSATAAGLQIASLERVKQLVDIRVDEGSERPIASSQANVNVLKARQVAADFADLQTAAEISLAQILGLPAGDQVRPAQEERGGLAILDSEEDSIAAALADSREVRRLESNLTAKQLEVRSYQAERLPKINLVSQYSLLSRFNNYDVFFPRFQRHNAQIGASIEIPIFMGSAPKAGEAQAEADIAKLRVELDRTRSRIAADIKRAYSDVTRAESARDLARADLDLAREQLSLDLAEFDEGRAPMAQVEAARATEQEKWLTYYDSQRALELARLNVLRNAGTLLAVLQ